MGIGQLRIGKLLFGSHSSKALHCFPYAQMPNAQLPMTIYQSNLYLGIYIPRAKDLNTGLPYPVYPGSIWWSERKTSTWDLRILTQHPNILLCLLAYRFLKNVSQIYNNFLDTIFCLSKMLILLDCIFLFMQDSTLTFRNSTICKMFFPVV